MSGEEDSDALELLIWKGDWGLPSIDHQCLTAMAYCKFADVPVTIIKSNNPRHSTSGGGITTVLTNKHKGLNIYQADASLPQGQLPVLKHQGEKKCTNAAIFEHLRKQQWGIEYPLTQRQSADTVSYLAMMEHKLLPALLHVWWADDQNYTQFTRPWYAKAVPFPLGLYLPNKIRDNVRSRLKLSKTPSNAESTTIYNNAKECINLLASKLGSKEYFLGTRPSLLDAAVFGHLAPLLKAPFPNKALQNHLKACTNLCHFCQRILDTYFPLSPEELEELNKQQEEAEKKQSSIDPEFPSKRRNMVIGGCVAVGAMLGYAYLSGLIQVDFVDRLSDQVDSYGLFESDGDENEGQTD